VGGDDVNPLLERLASIRPLDRSAVERFAADHGWPFVSGNHVTFVYYGDATRVNLRHWIYGLQGTLPFKRFSNVPLWYLELELPEKSRVEYKLEVVQAGHGDWILDPFNPHRAHDPFGANSVCHGPGYVRPIWTFEDPSARKGMLDTITIDSAALGDRRTVPIYLPARFRRGGRYPLLIVHDGTDYLRYAQLKVVLDNLIERLEIPALVAALTDPGNRLREYADDPRHARYLAEELVPTLESRLPVMPTPAQRCLLGASFGGVASLSAAWRYPGFYGRLLLQSGSFAFTDIGHHRRSHEFDPVVEFVNGFRKSPGRPSERMFLSCGVHESLIYENRSMLPVIQGTGAEVRFVEARDGHNWENWRDRLREGLSWLWPGPLWMSYE
jgi:enterochelin esterase family protein